MSSSSPTLQEEFQKYVNTENRYLVTFVDTSLECAFGWSRVFTRAVKDQQDIVPLLRELNKSGGATVLNAVYDLKSPVSAGGQPEPIRLKPETLKAAEDYYAAKTLKRQRRDWDNMGWNFKLFSNRP